jgi:hypothetical protein
MVADKFHPRTSATRRAAKQPVKTTEQRHARWRACMVDNPRSPHHQAKPSPRWLTIAHRFPEPPEVEGLGDDNIAARRVHMHITATLAAMFQRLDVVNTDAMLSPEGRRAKVNVVGGDTAAELARLDDRQTSVGNAIAVLRLHADEAEGIARRAIQPDPARLPLLTTLLAKLGHLDRPTVIRLLGQAVALLDSKPPAAASKGWPQPSTHSRPYAWPRRGSSSPSCPLMCRPP